MKFLSVASLLSTVALLTSVAASTASTLPQGGRDHHLRTGREKGGKVEKNNRRLQLVNQHNSESHRRLSPSEDSHVDVELKEKAEAACSHLSDLSAREACVYDIMETGDLEMAEMEG